MNTTIITIAIILIAIGVVIYMRKKPKEYKEISNNKKFDLYNNPFPKDSLEFEMFFKLNERRVMFNLPIFIPSRKTSVLAERRCKEIYYEDIETGEISHRQSADEFGELLESGADVVGENIAKGYSTIDALMRAFFKSHSHDRNILNPNFDWVGLYAYLAPNNKYYYCHLFAGDDEI